MSTAYFKACETSKKSKGESGQAAVLGHPRPDGEGGAQVPIRLDSAGGAVDLVVHQTYVVDEGPHPHRLELDGVTSLVIMCDLRCNQRPSPCIRRVIHPHYSLPPPPLYGGES